MRRTPLLARVPIAALTVCAALAACAALTACDPPTDGQDGSAGPDAGTRVVLPAKPAPGPTDDDAVKLYPDESIPVEVDFEADAKTEITVKNYVEKVDQELVALGIERNEVIPKGVLTAAPSASAAVSASAAPKRSATTPRAPAPPPVKPPSPAPPEKSP